MSDWRADTLEKMARHFGEITVVSEQHKRTHDTAHLVTFPGGLQLRVLPDGSHGARRARVVREACEALTRLSGPAVDLRRYLIGRLAEAGLDWEIPGDDQPQPTIEEWLEEEMPAGWASVSHFLRDLDEAGFEIVRKGDE